MSVVDGFVGDMENDEPLDLAPMALVDALLDAAVGADRIIAMAYAMKAQLLDTARRVHEGSRGARSSIVAREFRAESALALRVPERTAGVLLEESRTLVEDLPQTLIALGEALITPRHARVVVEQIQGLDEDVRSELEERALAEAHRGTGEFARHLRRFRERRAPESAVGRRRTAEEGRDVAVLPGADGMAWLSAHLPATELTAIDERLDETARALLQAGDTRTFSQLRADALCDILLDRDGDPARKYRSFRPTVIVTVPALTLMDRSDEPAELEGYGPIDPETARRIAAEVPEFRRMLTEPHTGVKLSLGRERYRPSQDLRLWLRLRDRTCRFPGCARKATACDVDHTVDWYLRGETCHHNLAHLCQGHHTLKHESKFSVRIDADGTLIWTTALGRIYRCRAPGFEPDRL